MSKILKNAVFYSNERLSSIVTDNVGFRPIELILEIQKVWLNIKINHIRLPVRDETLAEFGVFEGGAFYIDSGSAVLTQARHKPLADVLGLIYGHFRVIVCLDLDQRLLVVEVLEVAVDQVERR